MVYDVIVVGAGAIGGSIAYELSTRGLNVCRVGETDRVNAASKAAGAMNGCFGEVTSGLLASEYGRLKLRMDRLAQDLWPAWAERLARSAGNNQPLFTAIGTHVLLNSAGMPVPVMDLALFRNKTFSGSVVINLMSLAFLIGFVFFATQFLQIVLRMSALNASLALVPGQVLAIIVGMLVVPVVQRVPVPVLVPVLLAFTGAAFLLVASLGASLTVVVVAFALLNIGVGAIATVSNDVILSAAPPAKAGAASAISETAYEVGVVLGTAVLGGLVTAHYRGALDLPAFLTPVQEHLASETLAGAHAVAAALTGDQASELMSIAVNAFEGGIGLMSWVTFALAVMAIVIARWTLRVS
ncbi:FAD-dependent oxidoreductase [Pseudomonas guariconensis]|uniref:FAD-dependent oxidoreductase n=1 Tax=Pseudomonas guariconensis TaxID=1288410 RepID=UPI00384FD3AE